MRPRNILLSALLCSPHWGVAAGAEELTPISSAALHKRCLAYMEAPESEESRACVAYVRGFIEGSPRVVIIESVDQGRGGESFRERAFRTRLGRPAPAKPDYCIESTTSLREFIAQLLAHAEVNAPTADADASTLLYGTLQQHHRCSE